MNQVQELAERQTTELDLMMICVDRIEDGMKTFQNMRDNLLGPLLSRLPVAVRTPEEEAAYQEMCRVLDDRIERVRAERRREEDAQDAEAEKLRAHARVMFDEMPEGTRLSIHDVRTDYAARQAKAAADAALL